MQQQRLRALLDAFTGKRVMVIGDCMLDEYIWGRVDRISPEAPVMVVQQVDTTCAAGGASNVAVNIVAMGGAASIVSVVGNDPMADRLRGELSRQGVSHSGVISDPERPTTIKTRIVAHNQQVVRVDRETRTPLSAAVTAALVDAVRAGMSTTDAILFSDYSKGVLTEELVAAVLGLARENGVPTFANPKPASIRQYRGVSLVSLNQSEAEGVTGLSLADLEAMPEVGRRLMQLCDVEAAVITLGGRGLALFQADRPWAHLPVMPLEVYDPCGCGDSAIAAATLARAAGGDWVEAATLANLAGNAKVRKLGVVPVSRIEIESVMTLGQAPENGVNPNGKAFGPLGLGIPSVGRAHP
ncbi:MAG: bifunctional heptose 7-phosphate kinase/heptose 1-phosphate adenyltransferase [Actinomycetota bacterium]